MESHELKDGESAFTQSNIERLKQKYSQDMKNDPENPLKVCMKLIFNSASAREPEKRLALAQELSEFLTKSDGVMNLFLALIDFDSSSQRVTTHNQRFIAVANIITHSPKLCMPYVDYCANISSQLKTLLINENPKYSQLASIIFKSLIESPHAKNEDIVSVTIGPILNGIMTSDADFTATEAIMAIHNLVLNHLPTRIFVGAFPYLFYSLVRLSRTRSRLKSNLISLLVGILDGLECGVSCCLLEKVILYSEGIHKRIDVITEEDEISVKITDKAINELEEPDAETMMHVITTLLEKTSKEMFVLEFFFHFRDVMVTCRDDSAQQLCAALVEHLLEHSVEEESTKLDLLTTIATNSQRSLDLILRTLLNHLGALKSATVYTELTFNIICQSISACISILEVLSTTSNSSEDRNIWTTKCIPVLRQVQDLIEQDRRKFSSSDLPGSLKALIQKLEREFCDDKKSYDTAEDDKLVEGEFKMIMRDMNDRLIPVRVHALVRLKQLIMANNSYATSQISQSYTMVEALLAECDEPYVFLASINLIAEMALRKTDEILPKLMQMYGRTELNLQHRMNIGEVLVRLTKQLNATTPLYAQQVMNTLFVGCQDEEELMRVSNLVNIGQICQSLGDSLGNYIVEVIAHVETVLTTDTLQVKCAAVDLLRSALSGLDRLRVESIQQDLQRVYGLLKRVKYNALDDNLTVQVGLALDEIDRIARELLVLDIEHKGDLVKSIQVLSLLDR